ncbi:hypothetical protein [Duganella violaceipulchra]|uniref:Uncharacterized protein n=1 Tax=Duganella violaceipulchra TaxID=2849652 RepID=A0AA41H4Z2_9BURK|nr:hypothetical protein [Duganella violaceicalia]MBV6321708.1 hypothetical protein [Duganella violaceicalia]MCP2011178.1 hypothetical protein [Duganella violaceicalia]
MKKLIYQILTIVTWCWGNGAYGEEVWYPGGQKIVLTTAEKLHRSMSNAVVVAEGSFFDTQPDRPLKVLDETTGMCELEFHISRRLDSKGVTIAPIVRMKLVVYRALPGSSSTVDDVTLAKSRNAERAINGNIIVFDEYLKTLASIRSSLLKSTNYRKEFLLVPITVGGLDSSYRVADVVVQLRKKYLIFFMRNILKTDETLLFSTDLDIYDADEPEVTAVLKSIKN